MGPCCATSVKHKQSREQRASGAIRGPACPICEADQIMGVRIAGRLTNRTVTKHPPYQREGIRRRARLEHRRGRRLPGHQHPLEHRGHDAQVVPVLRRRDAVGRLAGVR